MLSWVTGSGVTSGTGKALIPGAPLGTVRLSQPPRWSTSVSPAFPSQGLLEELCLLDTVLGRGQRAEGTGQSAEGRGAQGPVLCLGP